MNQSFETPRVPARARARRQQKERVAIPPERDSDAQFKARFGVARARANRGYKMTCETSTIPKGVAARMSS